MRKEVRHLLLGMTVLPIILVIGTLGASIFLGWIGWESPTDFFVSTWDNWIKDGVGKFIRTISTVSLIIGILNIYIQKYLENG